MTDPMHRLNDEFNRMFQRVPKPVKPDYEDHAISKGSAPDGTGYTNCEAEDANLTE